MIELENAARTFGTRARTVHALRETTLALEPGVWGVVGPNGAGKTTLLALVLGFLRPTAGRVRIDGSAPRHYLRRNGAAYLPERFRLPPEWPVRDALVALARLEGLPGGEAATAADKAIERMGLEDHAHRPVGALSRGLLQRVGIAQATLAPRDLVVLDEPTEGLDPLWRVRLRELVLELRADGRTVLMASHELPEVERVADRVLLLRDGRVHDVVAPADRPAGPLRFRIRTTAPAQQRDAAFPGAEPAGDDGFVATVADHRELSDRLAALLDAGAVVRAVVPEGTALEDRVRERLAEDRPRERPAEDRPRERPEADA